MKVQLLAFAATLLAALGMSSPRAAAQKLPDAAPEEYKVYEAALALMDRIPKKDPHIGIYCATLNSKCGQEAYPAPLANGCTFLWMKPDTPATIKELLREDWAGMEDSTWADFEAKNAVSAQLHEPIATPWKHKLIGAEADPTEDWDSPDLTIFVSRVGFNQKKTEAVVYVLIFSYLDNVSTAGDYFLFRTDKNGHWTCRGRVSAFSMNKDQPTR